MSRFFLVLKNYSLFSLLFIYGVFFHISSSEFWPITISKTWFMPDHFEHSMMQKPLFTFCLSLFHLLPVSSVVHLLLVKAFFSVIGVISLYYFFKVSAQLIRKNDSFFEISLWTLTLCLLSPVILENFFRVRSDQVCFLFYILFIYFENKKWLTKALVSLVLMLAVSAKGSVFLPPALMILFLNTEVRAYIKKHAYLSVLAALGTVIWFINFNISSLTYLLNTVNNFEFNNIYLQRYWHNELILITISAISCLIVFLKKQFAEYRKYAAGAIYFLILVFIYPQSYPYFIASLVPFVYMIPVFVLSKIPKKIFIIVALIIVQGLWFLTDYSQKALYLYNPSQNQLRYISAAEIIIKDNHLTYLDGMGILPQSKFAPCYISPEDDIANKNCINLINSKQPEVVITTQRLSYVYNEVAGTLSTNYTQILPNFLIRSDVVLNKKVEAVSLPPPLLIFGFE